MHLRFIILAILLLFSALFSGSEAALFSLRRWRLERLARERRSWAKRSIQLLSDPWKLLMTILLGNDMVNIIISNLTANLRRQLLGPYGSWAIFPAALATLFLLLLLGEIMPKVIAVSHSEEFSRFTSPLIHSFSMLVSPITHPVVKILKRFYALFPRWDSLPKKMGTEEIKALLQISKQEGSLSDFEVNTIETIFNFSQKSVRYLMLPRTFMHCVPVSYGLKKALNYMRKNRLSYLPIYRESYDNIIGILTAGNAAKTKLGLVQQKSLSAILEQPLFVPQSLTLAELLGQMEENSIGIALVIDEYGGTAGIIDWNRIFQQLMGHLELQAHRLPSGIEKLSDRRYAVDAQIAIDQINQFFKREIHDMMANTLGGHTLNLFGYIPKKGESIAADQLIYTVAELEGNRLIKIILEPIGEETKRNKDKEKKE